ncbi:hypothetical protein Csa_013704 [Cucumis sativus]|nr:hypothetical protein Csa_013704 [Cucumis sativus]
MRGAVSDTLPLNYKDGVLKGHGTLDLNGEVVTTICGVVERVNKLIYVRALRAMLSMKSCNLVYLDDSLMFSFLRCIVIISSLIYEPEIGDIVAGRVTEVAPKRWRLDIHFSQDAVLMLSSMNLPDGFQRRRTAVDELNIAEHFLRK